MSLDSYKDKIGSADYGSDSQVDSDTESIDWDCNWHIDFDGYFDNVDERFFGEDKPHEPPLMEVPERLAAEIDIVENSDFASTVAAQWGFNDNDSYAEVVEVLFNDLSVWRVPVKSWDKDYLNMRDEIVEKYVPQVIKWEAILNGDDPSKALNEWYNDGEPKEPQWVNEIQDTELDEEDRKWLNKNADWLGRIDRKAQSDDRNVDVEVEEDYGWMDEL